MVAIKGISVGGDGEYERKCATISVLDQVVKMASSVPIGGKVL
jgi:hypothetical protein